MSSQEESDAMVEAKLATMTESYKKVGINTDECTLNHNSIVVELFGKIQKFLHHLVRQEIFSQLMAQAFVKGIISSAGSLTAADIWNINTWLWSKEGQTSIQDELKIGKLKKKAAKRLHKEMSSSSTRNAMERMVNEQFRKMEEQAELHDHRTEILGFLTDFRRDHQLVPAMVQSQQIQDMILTMDQYFSPLGPSFEGGYIC